MLGNLWPSICFWTKTHIIPHHWPHWLRLLRAGGHQHLRNQRFPTTELEHYPWYIVYTCRIYNPPLAFHNVLWRLQFHFRFVCLLFLQTTTPMHAYPELGSGSMFLILVWGQEYSLIPQYWHDAPSTQIQGLQPLSYLHCCVSDSSCQSLNSMNLLNSFLLPTNHTTSPPVSLVQCSVAEFLRGNLQLPPKSIFLQPPLTIWIKGMYLLFLLEIGMKSGRCCQAFLIYGMINQTLPWPVSREDVGDQW